MKNISRKIYGSLMSFMKAYMPKTRAQVAYYIAYSKRCNLKEPKTFSEKLLWLSLNTYRDNMLILQLSDKYLVREYVTQKGYSSILNELYFAYENINDIKIEDLPNKFSLKVSQGCQNNIICSNKKELDNQYFKTTMNQWSKGQFLYDKMMANVGGISIRELRKYYICEKYLENKQQQSPIDYKIYCFNGIPKAILVIGDRFDEKSGIFMTPKWDILGSLSGAYKAPKRPFEKPESLHRMIEIAKKLSEPFPFVRVDLYDIDGKVVFGEMTFFPNGCVKTQEIEIDGVSMGKLLDISAELG